MFVALNLFERRRRMFSDLGRGLSVALPDGRSGSLGTLGERLADLERGILVDSRRGKEEIKQC